MLRNVIMKYMFKYYLRLSATAYILLISRNNDRICYFNLSNGQLAQVIVQQLNRIMLIDQLKFNINN